MFFPRKDYKVEKINRNPIGEINTFSTYQENNNVF